MLSRIEEQKKIEEIYKARNLGRNVAKHFRCVDEAIGDAFTITCPYKRGAELTATKKRLRRGLFTTYLNTHINSFDATYTFVRRLSEKALGKSLCRDFVLKHYTTSGRTAKDKSKDIDRVDEIYDNFFEKHQFRERLEQLEALMKHSIESHRRK